MCKTILSIISLAAMLLGNPAVAQAKVNAVEMIDLDIQDINLTYSNGVAHITGAQGMVVKVYNLAGIMVKSFVVDGQDKRVALPLTGGVYIIKIGSSYTRKITVNKK